MLVTGRYAGGRLHDRTRDVLYEAVSPDVVAVDPTGLVTPRREGRAIIRVQGPGNQHREITVQVTHLVDDLPVHFANQVVPVFTKFGCNAGGCHGKASGKNGFKLSLLGFGRAEDYEYRVNEARGRRLFPAAPDHGLLLLKATGTVPHGGGKIMDKKSPFYRLLRRWIEQGMPAGRPDAPVIERIEVVPDDRFVQSTIVFTGAGRPSGPR